MDEQGLRLKIMLSSLLSSCMLSSLLSASSTQSTLGQSTLGSSASAGAAGKPVTIIRRATSAASLATSSSAGALTDADMAVNDADGANTALLSDPAVAELMQYGYPPARCAAALQLGGGDVTAALAVLFRQLAGGFLIVSEVYAT